MRVWANLCAMAVLTLVSTCGLSGCSKDEPAVMHSAKESGTRDEEIVHKSGQVHQGKQKGGRTEHEHHSASGQPGKVSSDLVKVGDKVPDFSVQTLDGKTLTLSALQKDAKQTATGVVVLSFWCSTCHSCRHVEHQLGKLAKDHEGQVAVFALDANANDSAQDVVAFAKKKGLALPIVLDPVGRSADLFGVQRTTTTVVIDGSGVLRYCGQFRQPSGASAEQALKAVLAGKEVAVQTTLQKG